MGLIGFRVEGLGFWVVGGERGKNEAVAALSKNKFHES